MRGRWETPDAPSGGYVCRTLRIPNSESFLALVNGSLAELTKRWNFEQVGDLTPQETADLFSIMYDYYTTAGGCMIGTIFAHANATEPVNSLPCAGITYNRSDYPDLYDSLDPSYHVSSTQFITPDLRGRTIVGDGTGASLTNRAFAATFGAETHALTIAELASHNHTYTAPLAVPILYTPGPAPAASTAGQVAIVTNTGGNGAHNNMHPSLALHYAIWAR